MFRNREDAAFQLAARLNGRELRDLLVLAIPQGGIVTGAVLARTLGADLDVVLARKLRAPGQPEFAIGALSEDGIVYLNEDAAEMPGLTDEYLTAARRPQLAEIARHRQLFRGVRPAAPITGRSVIVTDDGIATGSTMIAALQVARVQHPHEVIVAVPVAPPERLEEVRRWCDETVCLLCTSRFGAIGQFYHDFTPIADEQVVQLLRTFTPTVPTAGTKPRDRKAFQPVTERANHHGTAVLAEKEKSS
jgi:predicted phosphoribosyltransferase